MNKYIVKATKDIGITLEGTFHILADSRRKAKKSFRHQNANWQIVDVHTREIDGVLHLTPELQLEIDKDMFGI